MSKTVLITGASRGIGLACAKAFASAGYELFLTCRKSEKSLLSLKEELELTFHTVCHVYLCDMGCHKDVEDLFHKIKPLDVLINNAGISYIGLLQDMTPDQWHTMISTDLDSCFYTCKYAIPRMLASGGGKILNVSSVWGSVGASMEVAYSAAKGGVNAFTKALAKELAPSNIQVNAVSFGVIDTEMNQCFSKEERDALKEEIPADRFGTPEEAAKFILQISEAPAYLTGQIITMDGGWI